MLTSSYNAEYGRSSAGQVRIVTKSGTSQFHGTAYEYFRNSALNANGWQRNRTVGRQDISGQATPFRYNQYGWNLSGPLFIPGKFNSDRNKLFFMFSQEWTKFRREEFQQQRVPSDAMLAGNFSELLGPNQFFSGPRYIRDPLATGTCSAADQTACFPGNIIPANRLSNQGAALLRAYPRAIPGLNLAGKTGFCPLCASTINERIPERSTISRVRATSLNSACRTSICSIAIRIAAARTAHQLSWIGRTSPLL